MLVRHGETEWSRSGQHTSRTDLPLVEEGRARAQALAPMLEGWNFSLVLTSPLRRARETCELAGFGDRAEICEDLREWDYGDYEGLTTPQIREERPGWSLWQDGCPGGEQPEEVGARADRVLDRLRSGSDEGDALAFAHGHIFRVVAARWIELPASGGARLTLKAGAMCALDYERDTQVIALWNQTPR
ncbi:MAG: histidine phosphatase family protein [Solirubrobacterales bacterium]|nr:histidine phosphatase family protein [Solirubrobacterales bacterium]